jgi:HAD superfamily hydrolase (TIGR01457 family)
MDLERLSKARCFLIDLDGTMYLGTRLLPGARSLIEMFRDREIQFLFLTNNSSRHRGEYGEKLRGLGLEISDDDIFTSGDATAKYLSGEAHGAKVHVVGTTALLEVFEEHGFQLVDENPDVVVLGFDTTLTYNKLRRLCDFARDGVPYIATHPDLNCPVQDGFMPDIGATIAFVEASTGRQPDIIIGKPNRTIIDAVELKIGIKASELCMVGDRIYTDIALRRHGLTTVMVLSGETSMEDLQDSEIQPDYVVENLDGLVFLLQKIPRGL